MVKRWYIVHAYSNFENKVAQAIKDQALQKGLDSFFEEIIVPTEKTIEIRRGKKVNAEKKIYPGYVLVKCNLTDEIFHLIRTIPRVSGFLGSDKSKPIPISEKEANFIKNQMSTSVERPKSSIMYEIGETVRVADGPFATFNGVVEEVDDARSRLKITVSIFGRATPVELEYAQVEKI